MTATPKPAPAKAEVKAEPKSDSSKPVIEEVSSSEQTNWWQRKDNNYSAYDKPIDKPLEKVDDITAIKKQIDELKNQQEKLTQQAQAQKEAVNQAL